MSSEGSVASSYDSDKYGNVARAGFTRMYVLMQSPLDSSMIERMKQDDDAKSTSRKQYDVEDRRFQLLYASGRHYFHGTIDIPVELINEEDEDEKIHQPSIDDLPLLLPHFQSQQDNLESIEDFRIELRDVVYQMEEVGEFMIEELSKDKIIDRIEQGSKEFHWMISAENPTFFELQTYHDTNQSLVTAHVILVVMKIVVRGVLLDIIYHSDSYFITIRENANEIAFEDTFVPNLSCVGPCFTVRRYNDDDLKQLLLWCSFPTNPNLSIQGHSPTHCTKDTSNIHNLRPSSIVVPMQTFKSPVPANDTQLYTLWSSKETRWTKRENEDDGNYHVVFHFNNFVYHGPVHLQLATLDDIGRLSSHILPSLRAQALLSLKHYIATDARPPSTIVATHSLVAYFQSTIVPTLVDLVFQSQSWIDSFLAEIEAIATESAGGPESRWLGLHLRSWLESDGVESFYELELSREYGDVWAQVLEGQDEELELLIWKGIIRQAVVVIVYRRKSFYVILRDVESQSWEDCSNGLGFFGEFPPLESKGRGYLVHSFDKCCPSESEQWLGGAKLLLWQTRESIAREDAEAEKAQQKWKTSRAQREEEATTSEWFQLDAKGDEAKSDRNVRLPQESMEHNEQETCIFKKKRDRMGKRHHLAPLPQKGSLPQTLVAPWDIHTGRPL